MAESMMPADVVAVGETMIMLVPEDGSTLADVRRFDAHVGGAESNVASYLARLGATVRWASVMRDEPLAQRIVRELVAAGVDVSSIVWQDAAQTGLYLKGTESGTTTVYYYRQGSAARLLDETIWHDDALRDSSVLHLTGITPALSDSARGAVAAAVFDRCTGARTVAFDVNFRPGLWTSDAAAPVLRELSDAADLVFVGLDEAEALWGCRSVDDVRDVLPGAGTVVVKDGAVGAWAFSGVHRTFVPSLSVEVVEPVGAGDAFAAGYLKGLLDGRPPVQCLRLGHLLAATALTVAWDAAEPPESSWLEAQLELDDTQWANGLRIAPLAIEEKAI